LATKLYVGNLDYGMTGEQLGEIFAEAGKVVSATVISDRYSGRSKGFGFVEMGSEEEAKKAIEMFNGKDVQGRNIVVNEARPRRDDGGFNRGGFGGSRPAPASDTPAPAAPADDQSAPAEPTEEK